MFAHDGVLENVHHGALQGARAEARTSVRKLFQLPRQNLTGAWICGLEEKGEVVGLWIYLESR